MVEWIILFYIYAPSFLLDLVLVETVSLEEIEDLLVLEGLALDLIVFVFADDDHLNLLTRGRCCVHGLDECLDSDVRALNIVVYLLDQDSNPPYTLASRMNWLQGCFVRWQ